MRTGEVQVPGRVRGRQHAVHQRGGRSDHGEHDVHSGKGEIFGSWECGRERSDFRELGVSKGKV